MVAWQGGAARHRSGWHGWDTAAHDALAALLAVLDLARRELADLEQGLTVPRRIDRRDVDH